jgi:hypothetical protein
MSYLSLAETYSSKNVWRNLSGASLIAIVSDQLSLYVAGHEKQSKNVWNPAAAAAVGSTRIAVNDTESIQRRRQYPAAAAVI